MHRHIAVLLSHTLLALTACVPAEYRDATDLSATTDTQTPLILPLNDLLPATEATTTAPPEAQTDLDARNATLARRATGLTAQPAPMADTTQIDDRAEALRARADTIRERQ